MKFAIALTAISFVALGASAADIQPDEEAEAAWATVEGSNGKAIYMSDDQGPGLIFGCSDGGKISATINLEGSVGDKLALRSTRTRRVNGTLTVGDGEASTDKWAYLPTREMVAPVPPHIPRRLYNAAITGSEVSLDAPGRFSIQFVPAEPDANFRSFHNSCLGTR